MSSEILSRWPKWREQLISELRLNHVPGVEIGDILTEVAAHVDETGESPHEAFGDPAEYARSRSATVPTPPRNRRIVVVGAVVVACFVGGAMSAGGAWALGAGDPRWGPLPSWLALSAGLVLLLGLLLLGKPDLVTDPRSGTPLSGPALNPNLILGVTIASTIALIALAGWFFTG